MYQGQVYLFCFLLFFFLLTIVYWLLDILLQKMLIDDCVNVLKKALSFVLFIIFFILDYV